MIPHKTFPLGEGTAWFLIRRLYWARDVMVPHKTFLLGGGGHGPSYSVYTG
jgi:hypothetical protein